MTVLLTCAVSLLLTLPTAARGAMHVEQYRLDVQVDAQAHRLSGAATFVVRPDEAQADKFHFLLNRQLRVTAVREGTDDMKFSTGRMEAEAVEVTVDLAPASTAVQDREITVAYEGAVIPPGVNDADWMGVLLIRPDEIRMTEQTKWFPVVEGARTPFEAKVVIPAGLTLAAPGDVTRLSDDGRNATWRVVCDKPAAPAFIAGDYVTRTARAGSAALRVCLFADSAAHADAILAEARRIVEFLELQYGPAPFRTISICQMRILNSRYSYNYACPSYLVLPAEIVRKAGPEVLFRRKLAHELAHQWWGCCVQFDDAAWRLSESLAGFSEARFAQSLEPAKPLGFFLAEEEEACRAVSLQARSGKETPDKAYRKALAYSKGPWLLAMLRDAGGEKRFDESLRTFYRDHAYQAVSGDAFRAALAGARAEPVDWYFKQWAEERTIPRIAVKPVEPRADDDECVVEITQAEPVFRVPLEIELTTSAGRTTTRCFVERASQRHSVRIPGQLTRIVVDPSHKTLLEDRQGEGRLTLMLEGLRAEHAGLQKACAGRDWKEADRRAKTLCKDYLREMKTAMEIELLATRAAERGTPDAQTENQLAKYRALKGELEAAAGKADGAKLGRVIASLAGLSDEIHDSARDNETDKIPGLFTEFERDWELLARYLEAAPTTRPADRSR